MVTSKSLETLSSAKNYPQLTRSASGTSNQHLSQSKYQMLVNMKITVSGDENEYKDIHKVYDEQSEQGLVRGLSKPLINLKSLKPH